MKFPGLQKYKENIVNQLAGKLGLPRENIEVVASPYRICPLGAHIDHQGGPVLGMTIDAYTLLAFIPTVTSRIEMTSNNYPGTVAFDFEQVFESNGNTWGDYARCAVLALQQDYSLKRGVTGVVDGMLPGCGLSSSASVLLAYLYALTSANNITLQPWDYIRLTRRAESEYLGLNNGILDQASIVFGRKDTLVYIDTNKEDVTLMPSPPAWSDYTILIAYSGYSRELTATGFNTRVRECREAADLLAEMARISAPRKLADIPLEVFQQYNDRLPRHLSRRARHYFGEVQRVRDGANAWKTGHMNRLGQLMFESYKSSIELYECGLPALYDLQWIVGSATGMAGSRFMGGGFGGCVVGFVENEHATAAAEKVLSEYHELHSEVADQAAVYLTQSADGIRFLC